MTKIISLLFAFITITVVSCQTKTEKETTAAKKYEESKLSIEEIEKQSPAKFLTVRGTDKKNLVGQTVVKGKISNTAKVVSYKDVDVKLFFYSKTGALLMEDQEMVYETIAPGKTVNFKSKYFSPKGTDSIAMKVMSAKF